jgi:osmotically inducible protein OsmC
MGLNPVEVKLLDSGDYLIKLNHSALKDIDVLLSKVPENKRAGVARALLSASALYCMTGSLNHSLLARKIPFSNIKGSVSVKMGKNQKGKDLIESIFLDIDVDVSDENESELDRCIKYLEDGCLITRSLENGIKVIKNIRKQ